MGYLGQIKAYVVKAWKSFGWTDLRWAHLWIVSLIVGAGVINLLLPNGWTIWPLIPVMAAMIVINEAAERNDQGIPPLQIYAFVVVVTLVWLAGVIIMSQVPIFIQLTGVGALVWY